mmetsp:Transcript_16971/g.35629  ORF Transcript_16971/g.35629 Transcript_16971/m.35629 type:complete len:97 (-) Transcript_16971:262-552(-)
MSLHDDICKNFGGRSADVCADCHNLGNEILGLPTRGRIFGKGASSKALLKDIEESATKQSIVKCLQVDNISGSTPPYRCDGDECSVAARRYRRVLV